MKYDCKELPDIGPFQEVLLGVLIILCLLENSIEEKMYIGNIIDLYPIVELLENMIIYVAGIGLITTLVRIFGLMSCKKEETRNGRFGI